MNHAKFVADGYVIHAHRPWLIETEPVGFEGWWGAVIFRREVADVCLNCKQPDCNKAEYGCADFKRVAVNVSMREKQRRGRR